MAREAKRGNTRLFRRSLFKEITALIIILVAITLFEATQIIVNAWNGYTYAEQMVDSNSLVELILQAALDLSFERGRANLLLNSSAAPRPSDLRFIAARRSFADSNLEALLKADADRSDLSLTNVVAKYAVHREFREKIDTAIAAKPRSGSGAGNQELANSWIAESSAFIDELVAEATFLSFADRHFSGSFRELNRLKIDSVKLRLDLGAEATRIAATLASGLPLSEERREEILLSRGRGEAHWDEVKLNAKIIGASRVSAAIEKVQSEYFEKFRPLQDRALASLSDGRRSGPAAAAIFADDSVPALDSIAALVEELTAETGSEAERILVASRAALLRQSAIALGAIAIGALSALFVSLKLLAPIRRIGEQLESLAEGRLDTELTAVGRCDEMSAAYEALLGFRRSLQERHDLVERLKELSNSDTLTGLPNRRKLDEAIRAEWQRARRSGSSLAVVMIDIDHFKAFNDAHGHLAGDECLRDVARVLAQQVRRSGDLAVRFGGEEFLVLLPGLDAERAAAWAESLRQAVEGLQILPDDGGRGSVTISCGVASAVPTREMSAEDLIGIADAALYKAKAEGRNRVERGWPR